MMTSQPSLINGLDWDYLIVLDACRYDYFKDEYKKYLEGTLTPVESPGGDTPKWIVETFKTFMPVTYFSANPYISAIDHRWTTNSYKPSSHFIKIIDMWKDGWDDELGTVHPRAVNKAFEELYDGGKAIVHYLQPHFPAIGKTKLSIKLVEDLYKLDQEYIKQAYRDNLRLALSSVKYLIQGLDGKIVVTADHGELLGEDRHYWHPSPDGIWRKELRIVPWLEKI